MAGLIAAVARGGADDAWWQAAALEGVRRGMRGAGASLLDGAAPICSRWRRGPIPACDARRWPCSRSRNSVTGPKPSAAVTRALALAADPATDAARRADAIGLAALGGVASREAQFQAWVDPREPEAVQVAALAALATVPGEPSAGSSCASGRR